MEKNPDLQHADFQIDAVAMVRRIRDAQHDQLEGKSWEEQAAFFRARASTLHEQEDHSARTSAD